MSYLSVHSLSSISLIGEGSWSIKLIASNESFLGSELDFKLNTPIRIMKKANRDKMPIVVAFWHFILLFEGAD